MSVFTLASDRIFRSCGHYRRLLYPLPWWSVLLMEEYHQPAISHRQTLLHNVVSSTPRHVWWDGLTVTNVLAEIYILTYTLSKLCVFPACQSILINYISTFRNACSHVRVFLAIGYSFTVFVLYSERLVLLHFVTSSIYDFWWHLWYHQTFLLVVDANYFPSFHWRTRRCQLRCDIWVKRLSEYKTKQINV
jgi:hypothetical protein